MTDRICSIEGCERPRVKRDWCNAHYQRWRKHGDPIGGGPSLSPRTPPGTTCSIAGCVRGGKLRHGLCGPHHSRWLRHGDPLGGGPARQQGRICSVPECLDPYDAKGYCGRHYMKWREYGDPLAGGTNSSTTEERFEKFTQQVGECMEWVGSRTGAGYGTLAMEGGSAYAHRLAWERANGPIPGGLVVRHKCDNPPCVNPDHLEVGTQYDNIHDMIARGRAAWQKRTA